MKKLFLDMPNAKYHASDGISKTGLDLFAKDPHAVEWAKRCPVDEEKLKTFDFGDAMHAISLEPDRLKSEFVTMPPFNLRTNEGKESKKAFLEETKGHKVLTDDEHKKLHLMFESLMAHPECRKLIEANGVAESSYFYTDPETGILLRCRPDKIVGRKLIDVKTTPTLAKFHYSVDEFRYWIQAPWYCDIVRQFQDVSHLEFLVIQKTIEIGRYPCAVWQLPPEVVEYGRLTMRRELRKYADFMSSDKKPPTQYLEMPWRFQQEAEEAVSEVII